MSFNIQSEVNQVGSVYLLHMLGNGLAHGVQVGLNITVALH